MHSGGLIALLSLLAIIPSVAAAEAPSPTLQISPATTSISADTTVTVYVTIANPSTATLSKPQLTIRSDAVDLKDVTGLGTEISPYWTVVAELHVYPKEKVFGTHTVLVSFEYQWVDGTVTRLSAVVGTTPLTIQQPLEEEAKGLPGGTVALLYLLLPVIPAFLVYQLAEQFRTNQPRTVPVFGAEHIPFAFFVAITVAVIRLMAGTQQGYALAQPRGLLTTVAWSALVGALLPAWRWAAQSVRKCRWELRPDDNLESYARKALQGPGRSESYTWVTGKAGARTYAGLRLSQYHGSKLLGATLQVNPASRDKNAADRAWKSLMEAIDEDGHVLDDRKLVKLIRGQTVSLRYLKKVVLQDQQVDAPIAGQPPDTAAEQNSATAEPLIRPVR